MSLPGFVATGTAKPLHFRGFIYGEPKRGKTVFCGSWPAPLLMNPVIEGGFDTFRDPDGGLMFDVVALGEEHHMWLQDHKSNKFRKVSDEVRLWMRDLSSKLHSGSCPYQTVVLGGFHVIQEMVKAEGDVFHPKDGQKAWGYVARWATELLQMLCAFPAHVLIECGAVGDKDRGGDITKWAPAVAGKTYNSILHSMNAVMYQSTTLGGQYMTSVAPSSQYVAGTRLPQIAFPQPIQNACYDTFAQPLGFPPIYEADPNHPRVKFHGTAKWPWAQQTF